MRRRPRGASSARPEGELFGLSHVGRVRTSNEDSWIGHPVQRNPWTALVAVADGMGGHAGGDQASSLAITVLLDSMKAGSHEADFENLLVEAFERANHRVFNIDDKRITRPPGTTMTAALVSGGRYVVGHIGDTRAYVISSSRIVQITEDHSWVSEQVRIGLLRPGDAQTSPHRSHLVRVLGTQPNAEPSFYQGILNSGDILLICSDGLWEDVDPIEISEGMQRAASLSDGVRMLVDLALNRGGEDNITVVALRHGGPVTRREELDLLKRARAPTPVPGSARVPGYPLFPPLGPGEFKVVGADGHE